EAWRGAETVVIVDAMLSGATPGAIFQFDAGAQPLPKISFRCSTHAFGVAEAIEMARALCNIPQRLIVYGIEGKNFTIGMGLPAEVEMAACEAAKQALVLIQQPDSDNQTFL